MEQLALSETKTINNKLLVAKLVEGNEKAFSALFNMYCNDVYAYSLSMLKNQVLAEEIVQDAFVKIWLRRETLKSVENFGKYMYVICRNKTLDELKKIANQKLSHTRLEKVLVEESEVELLDNPTDVYRQMIEDAVSKLPEQQRRVYMLSRYDRLKNVEIAQKLGLSESTTKKHLQLAVKFIQSSLSSKVTISIVLVLTTPITLI